MSRVKREPKICPICGKEFYTRWRTCSIECGRILRNQEAKEKWRLKREEKQQELEKQFHPCLQCGKLIEPWKKFCNRSCAASFNNSVRVRHPWSEEQRNAVRLKKSVKLKDSISEFKGRKESSDRIEHVKQHVCRFCKKPFYTKGSGRMCPECAPYFKVNLYKKLDLLEGPLKDRYQKSLEIITSLYLEGMSLPEIEEKTGVNVSILRALLLRVPEISLRSKSEGQKQALLTGRRKVNLELKPNFKQGTHTTWEGKQVTYRSSWELLYAKSLDDRKVSYSMESIRIPYFDTKLNKERVAIPDFYLPNTNEIVELKSDYTLRGKVQEMKDKFKAYQEEGYRPKLILNWKEVVLDDNFTENSF